MEKDWLVLLRFMPNSGSPAAVIVTVYFLPAAIVRPVHFVRSIAALMNRDSAAAASEDPSLMYSRSFEYPDFGVTDWNAEPAASVMVKIGRAHV